MQYNKTMLFNEYLQTVFKEQKVDPNTIAAYFSNAQHDKLHDWMTYSNHRPNLENLIRLSELLNVDFKQMYWMWLLPNYRQKVNKNASLPLIASLIVNRYLSGLKITEFQQKMGVKSITYNKWIYLQTPMTNKQIERMADLFKISKTELIEHAQPLINDPKFKANFHKKPKPYQVHQPDPASVGAHLKQIVKNHPYFHDVKALAKPAGLYSSIMYEKAPHQLQVAKKIAKILNIDLQRLLGNDRNNGTNQLFQNVFNYCRNHDLTIPEFEEQNYIKESFVLHSRSSKYLNALTKLGRMIPTKIDQLVDPKIKTPKILDYPIQTNVIQVIEKPVPKTKQTPKQKVQSTSQKTDPKAIDQSFDQNWLNQIHQLNHDQQFLLKTILHKWQQINQSK